jgi:hypothetical protein
MLPLTIQDRLVTLEYVLESVPIALIYKGRCVTTMSINHATNFWIPAVAGMTWQWNLSA